MVLELPAAPASGAALAADPIVFWDGKLVPMSEANVSIFTHALHYGTGVFEGIRAYWSDERRDLLVLKLDEHIDRFFRSCAAIRIDLPFTREEMRDVTLETIRRNGFRSDLYIRPVAFKSAHTIKLTLSSLTDSVAILAFPFGKYAHREGGLRLGLSSWRRVDENAIPIRAKVTGGYINASLASDDAARNGYDEALLLNSAGYLSEASSANVFLVRNGRLVTPDVSQGILEGVTRAAVIELARREMNLEVEERAVGRTEVQVADEMFLTGTGMEIQPVASVDGNPVGTGATGPITERLQALYGAAAHGRIPGYAGWCTPVYHERHAGPGD